MVRLPFLPLAGLAVVIALQGCDPSDTDVYLTNKTGRDILYAPLLSNNAHDTHVGSFVKVPSRQRVMVEKNIFQSPEDAMIKDALTGKVISKVHYQQDPGSEIEITYPPEPPARYFDGFK